MSGVYSGKDFVEVVDGDGNRLERFPHPVPKAWVGTDLLPPGAKAKGKSTKASADGGDKTEPEGS